jgi:hypothetical protein
MNYIQNYLQNSESYKIDAPTATGIAKTAIEFIQDMIAHQEQIEIFNRTGKNAYHDESYQFLGKPFFEKTEYDGWKVVNHIFVTSVITKQKKFLEEHLKPTTRTYGYDRAIQREFPYSDKLKDTLTAENPLCTYVTRTDVLSKKMIAYDTVNGNLIDSKEISVDLTHVNDLNHIYSEARANWIEKISSNPYAITQESSFGFIPILENLERGEIMFANLSIKESKFGVKMSHQTYNPKIIILNMISREAVEINLDLYVKVTPAEVGQFNATLKNKDGFRTTLISANNNGEVAITHDYLAREYFLKDDIKKPVMKYTEFRKHEDLSGFLEAGTLFYTAFFEKLFDVPVGTLNNRIPLGKYISFSQYTNSLFQAFLMTKKDCPWFLDNMISTVRDGGKPLNEKNIQSWLGMNLPDLKHLLSQPNQDMLIHFLLTNKNKPTSMPEFLKIEGKIKELNDKWLKEFEHDPNNPYSRGHDLVFKNKRNKFLFETNTLPAFMSAYVRNTLHHHVSMYQYMKYLIDEGKRSYNKDDGTYLTLTEIETLLFDYNRMLKAINPRATFYMPYKLKSAHDTMNNNYAQIVSERQAEGSNHLSLSYSQLYSVADEKCNDSDTFVIVRPTTGQDLYMEGANLNHCVGGYQDAVVAGKSMIFFLRETKTPTKSRITIELKKSADRNYYIAQMSGLGNRRPTTDERAFADQWVSKFNESYIERKKIKEAERREVTKFEKKYEQPVIDYLKLNGVKTFKYDDQQTREQNYTALVTGGLKEIVVTQKQQGIWIDQNFEAIKSDLVRILKQVKISYAEMGIDEIGLLAEMPDGYLLENTPHHELIRDQK